MARLEIKGIDALVGALEKNATMDDVKTIVKDNGAELTKTMKAKTTTAYVKGYSTGDTAGSINLKIENGGLTAVVGSGMNYTPYVEYGTRFMEAEPIVQPSLDKVAPQFFNDLKRLMK